MKFKSIADLRIAIIGLGYVGLPLAIAFSRKSKVVGFDVDEARIEELRTGKDRTGEVDSGQLKAAKTLTLTADPADLETCNCFIVTVPTPIDRWKRPDLSALQNASAMVSQLLQGGDLVIFESTVFPGATEDICGAIIAESSGLDIATSDSADPDRSFYLGYSPERINPGDRRRKLENIVKVTSGSTPAAAKLIDDLYSLIIEAGTHRASSIKVAEAAKVIENTQRDVNIALINELAQLFYRMDIDTEDVLVAAGTKWNFLSFMPGLVGGHCIGVDPYYLTHKAIEVGQHPEMILAGRRINDGMVQYLAGRIVRLMLQKQIDVRTARVLVMGVAFKEDCPDTRNSRVVDLVHELEGFNCHVDVHDPCVADLSVGETAGLSHVTAPEPGSYDAIVVAVAHSVFKNQGAESMRKFGKERHILFDVKYAFQANDSDGRL